MAARTRSPTLLLAALLLAAPALAQQHGHDGGDHFVVLHDNPEDGHAIVGSLTHFGFALVDPQGQMVRHHDARFTLTQNGVTLLDTPAAHEYDGLFSLDYTFAVPGPYQVVARSDTGAEAVFNGTAAIPAKPLDAKVEVEAPAGAAALAPVDLVFRVVDGSGELVPHSDVLVEARRAGDGLLVTRQHLHTHTEPMAMTFAFPLPGAYDITALGYIAFPEKTGGIEFATAVGTARVDVGAPAPAAPALPPAPAPRVAAGRDAAALDHPSGMFTLAIDHDPDDVVGPLSHVRLSALVFDAEGAMQAVQHVNFKATVLGPGGAVVFRSEHLHEYDGHLELLLAGLAPGAYTWDVEAQRREWTETKQGSFLVAPPAVPLGSGPVRVVVEGAESLQAGVPAELTISLRNAAGVLVPHSEVDLAVLRDGSAAPVLLAKFHSHMEPAAATITFPEAGAYVLRAEGDSLQPSLPLYVGQGGAVGQSALIPLEVAEGPGLPRAPEPLAAAQSTDQPLRAPGLEALGAALAVGMAALAARRRR